MIGAVLRNLRKKHHISQEELAKELGITRQAISRWENDIAAPDLENLKLLSKYYKVSVDYLLNNELEVNKKAESEETPLNEKNDIFDNGMAILLMISILICSCWIAPLGLVVSVLFFIMSRRILVKRWKIAVMIICISAFVISAYNCSQLLTIMFAEGQSNIEYLG